MKANGRRSFRHPRNPAGHKSTTTTRKANTHSQRCGNSEEDKPEARVGVEAGATRLERKQKGEWRKLSDDGLTVGTPPSYMALGSQESRRAVQ